MPQAYHTVTTAHAAISCLAWVLFFPLGAILVRAVTYQARRIHVIVQSIAATLMVAGWSMGVWMATVSEQWVSSNGHAIIGSIVFGLALSMPVLGLLHHLRWKKNINDAKKMYTWAWIHVWLGRTLVTVGIINGGLGLQLSENTVNGEIAYGVIAGFIWCVYVAVTVVAIVRSRGDISVRGESGEKVQGLKHLRLEKGESVVEELKNGSS